VQAYKIKDHATVNQLLVNLTPITDPSKNNNLADIMLNFSVLRLQMCCNELSLINYNFDIFYGIFYQLI
jgi:hypothetical protein